MVAGNTNIRKNVTMKMKLKNQYYVLRHGEAISNVKSINSSWPEKFHNPITSDGEKQVKKSLKKLRGYHIDFIFSSDLLRTKMTAGLASKLLKVEPKFDKRLREISFGSLNGESNGKTMEQLFHSRLATKNHKMKKVETYQSILKRISSLLKEIEKKYKDKTILIVSHQAPLWILENKVKGLTIEKALETPRNKRINKGELKRIN